MPPFFQQGEPQERSESPLFESTPYEDLAGFVKYEIPTTAFAFSQHIPVPSPTYGGQAVLDTVSRSPQKPLTATSHFLHQTEREMLDLHRTIWPPPGSPLPE